jgi:hypothetical protein
MDPFGISLLVPGGRIWDRYSSSQVRRFAGSSGARNFRFHRKLDAGNVKVTVGDKRRRVCSLLDFHS